MKRAKRIKRAYLKRWSADTVYVPKKTPTGLNTAPQALQDALRGQYRAVSGLSEMWDNKFIRMFGLDLGQGGPPRMAIVRRLRGFNQENHFDLEKNICLVNTKMKKLMIIQSSLDASCYFICTIAGNIRRSKIYSSRSVAMFAFNKDPYTYVGITWVEE